jgi:hypothetical protein
LEAARPESWVSGFFLSVGFQLAVGAMSDVGGRVLSDGFSAFLF